MLFRSGSGTPFIAHLIDDYAQHRVIRETAVHNVIGYKCSIEHVDKSTIHGADISLLTGFRYDASEAVDGQR